MRSTLNAFKFVAASLVGWLVSAGSANAEPQCPADTTYMGQWAEASGNADITHIQCQELSDDALLKIVVAKYPEHFTGDKPPTLPSNCLPNEPYGEVTPRHWWWAHAPSTGYLSKDVIRQLARDQACPVR